MKNFQKTGALALALLLAGGAVAPTAVVQAAETQDTEVTLEQAKENALKKLKEIGQEEAFKKQVEDAKTIDEVNKIVAEAEEKSKEPKGYATKEEAEKAAEDSKDEVNIFATVAKDEKDGKWYYLVGPAEITEEEVLEGYIKKEDAEKAAKEDKELEGKEYEIVRGKNGRFITKLKEKEEENNEVGYLTKENAEVAAKEALESDLVNIDYEVVERDGRFFYELKISEKEEEPKEENLEEIKAKAVEEIKGLENLNHDESQREKLIELVKDATTKEDVEKILNDARNVKPGEVDTPIPETDLGEYKEKAIETIKGLKLTAEKKKDYIAEVNKANDKQRVDAVVNTAKKDAEETPKVDFAKLEKAIINGDKAHKDKKATVKQSKHLEKLLADAVKVVGETESVTQEEADKLADEINELVKEINSNKVNLGGEQVQKSVDKKELSNLIVEADKIIKDLEKGTVEQRDNLTRLLNEGRQVRDNDEATQEEVNKAAKNLKDAIDEINGVSKDEKAAGNAKTGVTGIATVAGVLAAATASFAANKKRR